MEKIKLLPASTRGNTNVGWLNGYHSFSFSEPAANGRGAFGPLIVLNEDTVLPGTGFGTHSHSNMEIITIPLEGSISHRDTTGKEARLKSGDVQVMSAGTGIAHSEHNLDREKVLRFLQIWIVPDRKNVEPRYQQVSIGDNNPNQFHQLVSPHPEDGNPWIYQQAWIFLGEFDAGQSVQHLVKKKGDGVYLFLLSGGIVYSGHSLQARDALEIEGGEVLAIEVVEQSKILLIEVPLS
jgi:redox-sensitive bicupin YhaK (pirin superfamily)